jgi:acetyl-CoA carboxylase carboxyltransferase component
MQGTIVSVNVAPGDLVPEGRALLVLESMKMQHDVVAPASGRVVRVGVAAGDTVAEGQRLAEIELAEVAAAATATELERDLDEIREDLAEVVARHEKTLDAARPDAVARRRKTGQRTARENVDDLCDEGSFVEYAPLVIAAQRRRRSVDELIERTPADGLICGLARVNGDLFGDDASRCVVVSYDYTVLAGTQGMQNHRKKDRMFELAAQLRLPLVIFTEGGGGRPGDTDTTGVAGLDVMAFNLFAKLSGLVPLVGVNSGRCFAGNAALLGMCDVVIATRDSTIGMGGPAMIEGGGLGVVVPEDVGPIDVHIANGVADVVVEDEAGAVAAAKKYLSYFQGAVDEWECADQRLLRDVVPENRLKAYDVRQAIRLLADTGTVLELREGYGVGMITALVRIEGRPLGVVANNPSHLAGAIDSAGADKAARFMQLCDAFDLPLLFLCDTPGIMVGPEVEKTGLVRHAARMFVNGANLTVPAFTIVLRKAYGLGAQAMAAGSFKAPVFAVAWPTGEFGGMGLEGAVKLGYRRELEAIEDADERERVFQEMVEQSYRRGKALNTASHFEIDDVIDPAESRKWVTAALRSLPAGPRRTGKKRPAVDTW